MAKQDLIRLFYPCIVNWFVVIRLILLVRLFNKTHRDRKAERKKEKRRKPDLMFYIYLPQSQ